jgi:hypothetical protein
MPRGFAQEDGDLRAPALVRENDLKARAEERCLREAPEPQPDGGHTLVEVAIREKAGAIGDVVEGRHHAPVGAELIPGIGTT